MSVVQSLFINLLRKALDEVDQQLIDLALSRISNDRGQEHDRREFKTEPTPATEEAAENLLLLTYGGSMNRPQNEHPFHVGQQAIQQVDLRDHQLLSLQDSQRVTLQVNPPDNLQAMLQVNLQDIQQDHQQDH
ncbi:hypothetical protein BGZ68_002757 [Mortierella alpina]|nr:hypothetical protein BGZ68_002757 [Mortierella alpina]